jgi:hypothetical protein
MKRTGISRSSPSHKKLTKGVRHIAGDGSDGCTYTVSWSDLVSTDGYVQVWVPVKLYDKGAAAVLKGVKGKYARKLIRQRVAPLGLDVKCGGDCKGGFCGEQLIDEGPGWKNYICACNYIS